MKTRSIDEFEFTQEDTLLPVYDSMQQNIYEFFTHIEGFGTGKIVSLHDFHNIEVEEIKEILDKYKDDKNTIIYYECSFSAMEVNDIPNTEEEYAKWYEENESKLNEIVKRETNKLLEAGFVSNYNNPDLLRFFIYPNEIGKQLIDYLIIINSDFEEEV